MMNHTLTNELAAFLSTIRWQDMVDIGINSYILFRIYALFKGTKVFRTLIGIGFLWIFHEITVSLGFIVTSLAIEGIIALAAFIVIIVFSNEIRSVFQSKNLRAILWEIPKKAIHTPVDIIVESAYEMGQKYCGALIVLPGKDDLKNIVQSGIPWDGLVSKEMILSIFGYKNPVHDGAIIIQGDRVTQVGVILPLSTRNLPSNYGTRHRAAKGLSDVSDALVIVVSEERGSVLMAKGDRLSVMYDKSELEKELKEHVGIRAVHREYFNRESFHTYMAALFSVFVIVGIWFMITKGLNTLITIEVPLEYMNRDPGMKIVSTTINNVQVQLNGSDILVKSIRPEQIRVRVDMSQAIVGHNAFPIKKENILLPPGILLTKLEPKIVEMQIEAPIKFKIPIEYTHLDLGMEILNASNDNVYIHLSTSEDRIESIRPEDVKIRLDMKNATPGDHTLRITRENITLPPGVFLRKLEPESIFLKIDRLVTRELPIQVDWVGKLKKNLILTQALLRPEKIHLMGHPQIIDKITTIYTKEVQLDNIEKSDKINVPLRFDKSVLKTAPDSLEEITVEYIVTQRDSSVSHAD